MPTLWPLKVPERGNAITRRKTLEIEYSCLFIHHTIWIYPFPHHLFNTPKKSLLKSSYPKKYLPIFRTQKNPGIENFKPKKTLWSSPSLEILSTPPPPRDFNQVSQKKYLPNFSTKKILELKMSSPKRKPSIIPMTLKSGLAPALPAGCVNRIILKLLLLIHIVYPTLLAESLSFFLGKFTLRESRVSNQSFNIPSQSTPWTFDFFSKINIQIPTAWAKMPFRYPIIVSF